MPAMGDYIIVAPILILALCDQIVKLYSLKYKGANKSGAYALLLFAPLNSSPKPATNIIVPATAKFLRYPSAILLRATLR
jgi:hypothetical protein